MSNNFNKWREEGKHLPEFLRDFHDQKDLFKYLHDAVDIEDHGMVKDINWTQGHAYVIDIFLFVMAKYGYTLQKSRSHFNFSDLESVIQENNKRRSDIFAKSLLGHNLNETPNIKDKGEHS